MQFNNPKLNSVWLYAKEVNLNQIASLSRNSCHLLYGAYSALSVGKKNTKTAPSLWDCTTPPEEDRATAIGNMLEQFGKDRAWGLGDMLADRQTHTQTDLLITILRHCCGGEVITTTTGSCDWLADDDGGDDVAASLDRGRCQFDEDEQRCLSSVQRLRHRLASSNHRTTTPTMAPCSSVPASVS